MSNSHSWLPMPVARDSKSEQSGQIHESEAPTTDHSCLSINNSKPSLFFSPVHRKQFIPFEHNFKSLISNFFLNHLVDFFPIQSCLLSIISFFFKKRLRREKSPPMLLSSVSFLFDISTCNKTYLEYIILTWLMLKCLAYRIDSRTDTSHACDLVQNSYKLSPRVERKV